MTSAFWVGAVFDCCTEGSGVTSPYASTISASTTFAFAKLLKKSSAWVFVAATAFFTVFWTRSSLPAATAAANPPAINANLSPELGPIPVSVSFSKA